MEFPGSLSQYRKVKIGMRQVKLNCAGCNPVFKFLMILFIMDSLISHFKNLFYFSAVDTTGDFLDPEIDPESLESPALAGRFFTTSPPGKPMLYSRTLFIHSAYRSFPQFHSWVRKICWRQATYSSILGLPLRLSW